MTHLYESFVEKTQRLITLCEQQPLISYEEVFSTLGYSSHYVLILFLTIPFLQPIPIPGLSTIFGVGICMSSLCVILSRRLYLPHFLKRKTFSSKKCEKIASSLLKLSNRLKRWLHPRGRFMARHTLLRKFNGIALFIGGILLAFPLPIPLTNTLPAYAIASLSIGSLKEDGLFICIGDVLLAISVVYILLVTEYSLHLLGMTL